MRPSGTRLASRRRAAPGDELRRRDRERRSRRHGPHQGSSTIEPGDTDLTALVALRRPDARRGERHGRASATARSGSAGGPVAETVGASAAAAIRRRRQPRAPPVSTRWPRRRRGADRARNRLHPGGAYRRSQDLRQRGHEQRERRRQKPAGVEPRSRSLDKLFYLRGHTSRPSLDNGTAGDRAMVRRHAPGPRPGATPADPSGRLTPLERGGPPDCTRQHQTFPFLRSRPRWAQQRPVPSEVRRRTGRLTRDFRLLVSDSALPAGLPSGLRDPSASPKGP